MRRRHLPEWIQLVGCPTSFVLPAGRPPRPLRVAATPDRTAPVAVPVPSPSGPAPGRGGTNLHPY